MTSLVDMRYTLFAPASVPSYDSESDSASSEEIYRSANVKLENDPILGNMEYWNNELMRLGDELCKYGVTDIFMENKKSPGTQHKYFPRTNLPVFCFIFIIFHFFYYVFV